MRNKQIIVNDVDVSGCEFAVKPINDNRIKCHCAKGLLQIAKMQEQPECIKSGLCENNHNCYYKQLKRKEQENKRLLEIINAKPLETVDIDSAFEIEKLKEQLQAKVQECEGLKAKIEYVFSDVSPNFNNFCDVCVAKDNCNQSCCFEQIKELIYEAE